MDNTALLIKITSTFCQLILCNVYLYTLFYPNVHYTLYTWLLIISVAH